MISLLNCDRFHLALKLISILLVTANHLHCGSVNETEVSGVETQLPSNSSDPFKSNKIESDTNDRENVSIPNPISIDLSSVMKDLANYEIKLVPDFHQNRDSFKITIIGSRAQEKPDQSPSGLSVGQSGKSIESKSSGNLEETDRIQATTATGVGKKMDVSEPDSIVIPKVNTTTSTPTSPSPSPSPPTTTANTSTATLKTTTTTTTTTEIPPSSTTTDPISTKASTTERSGLETEIEVKNSTVIVRSECSEKAKKSDLNPNVDKTNESSEISDVNVNIEPNGKGTLTNSNPTPEIPWIPEGAKDTGRGLGNNEKPNMFDRDLMTFLHKDSMLRDLVARQSQKQTPTQPLVKQLPITLYPDSGGVYFPPPYTPVHTSQNYRPPLPPTPQNVYNQINNNLNHGNNDNKVLVRSQNAPVIPRSPAAVPVNMERKPQPVHPFAPVNPQPYAIEEIIHSQGPPADHRNTKPTEPQLYVKIERNYYDGSLTPSETKQVIVQKVPKMVPNAAFKQQKPWPEYQYNHE